MHTIYNKNLKNTVQLIRKIAKPLNLIITLFASKIDEMRSNTFSPNAVTLERFHVCPKTFKQTGVFYYQNSNGRSNVALQVKCESRAAMHFSMERTVGKKTCTGDFTCEFW